VAGDETMFFILGRDAKEVIAIDRPFLRFHSGFAEKLSKNLQRRCPARSPGFLPLGDTRE
jgi:hypothetical protein